MALLIGVSISLLLAVTAWAEAQNVGPFNWDRTVDAHADGLLEQGREIFRYDTFGSEAFWGDTLRLHEAIQASVSPAFALELGLKLDEDARPGSIRGALKSNRLDLDDPAMRMWLAITTSISDSG